MRAFKLLLTEIKEENYFGESLPDAIKRGRVAFPFIGEVDDKEVSFKKGDEVGYQYGSKAVIDDKEYILISLSSLVWLK